MAEPADFELHSPVVPAALRPYVADISGYRYRGEPPAAHRGLPSGALTLVITLDEPLGLAWPGAAVEKYDALVSGLHSTAVHIGESPNVAGLQLALTPAGSRALLGMPPGELAGIAVPLDEAFGHSARELMEQLRDTASWERRFELVSRSLLARSREDVAEPRPEVSWAWHRLRRTAGRVGVQELAAEVGWSRRHLTEQFRQEYGLAPKVAARVFRFERAVARLRRLPHTRLADLAADLGYADQAHLTREWHALAGCSPRQWITEELPFVQDRGARAEAESQL